MKVDIFTHASFVLKTFRKLKLLPVFCEGPIGIGLVPDFNKSSAKLSVLSWTLLFNICTAAIPPFPAVCGAVAVHVIVNC